MLKRLALLLFLFFTANCDSDTSVPSTPDASIAAAASVAACTAFDGSWRCRGAAPKAVMAASTQPIIPVSWTVPAWFVDPANVTTTASDGNDCTTSATACLTYQEIAVHRWGTYSPRIQQDTTLTFWSSQSAATDPIICNPYLEGGGFVLKGNLGSTQQIATGTLASTTAKNRSTPQLLQTNSGATAINQLVVNATHSSRAWTYKSIGAGIFSMSQPKAPITVPGAITNPTSVDTWANTDSVTVFAPPQVFIAQLMPHYTKFNAGVNNNQFYVYQLNATNLGGTFEQGWIGAMVSFVEAEAPTYGINVTSEGLGLGSACVHANANFSSLNGQCGSVPATMTGGIATAVVLNGLRVGGDIILGSTASSLFARGAFSQFGAAYIESGSILNLVSSAVDGQTAFNGSTAILWGPGVVNLRGATRFSYPAGAGAAAAAFLVTGGLQANAGTLACVGVPSVGAPTLTCNITISAANLDTNLGATTGCLWVEGGASYCNGAF